MNGRLRITSNLAITMNTANALRLVARLVAGLAVASCAAVAPPSEQRIADTLPKASCRDRSARPDPLIVDWPTSVRSDLEMMRAQGLVAVRWQGCDFEILKRCSLPGSYKYLALTPKHDSVKISDEAGLEANLPFYGASFAAELKRKGELNATMDIVGAYRAMTEGIATNDLRGDCAQATHVITTMNVGAFEFFSGQERSDSAGVKVPVVNVGAGVNSSQQKQVLQQDGDMNGCNENVDGNGAPPAKCGATVRIELRALDRASVAQQPGQGPSLKRRRIEQASP